MSWIGHPSQSAVLGCIMARPLAAPLIARQCAIPELQESHAYTRRLAQASWGMTMVTWQQQSPMTCRARLKGF